MAIPRPRDGVPPPQEFGEWRAFLALQGVSQQWITDAIGIGAQGRTRAEITAELRAAFKASPKG